MGLSYTGVEVMVHAERFSTELAKFYDVAVIKLDRKVNK